MNGEVRPNALNLDVSPELGCRGHELFVQLNEVHSSDRSNDAVHMACRQEAGNVVILGF